MLVSITAILISWDRWGSYVANVFSTASAQLLVWMRWEVTRAAEEKATWIRWAVAPVGQRSRMFPRCGIFRFNTQTTSTPTLPPNPHPRPWQLVAILCSVSMNFHYSGSSCKWNYLALWFWDLALCLQASGSLVSEWLRICLPVQETWVPSLGQEDPLEKEMATHSSVLAWEIPRTEESGWL